VDLRTPEGIALVRDLVPHCDIGVENFKPGIIAAMGLGYDALCELRKDIILWSISALGQNGPLSSKPGCDFIAQADAAITSMIGDPDGPPSLPLAAMEKARPICCDDKVNRYLSTRSRAWSACRAAKNSSNARWRRFRTPRTM
jgi:hypothetical protein